LDNFYVRVTYPPLVALVIMAGSALFLSSFDIHLAYSLLFFLILGGIVLPAIIFKVSQIPGRQLIKQRANLNAVLIDTIQGMADILISNAEKRQQKRIETTSHLYKTTQTHMAHITAWQNALSIFISLMAVWCGLIISIPIVRQGQLDGVFLAVIIMIVLSSFEAVQPLPLATQYLQTNIAATQRLRQIIDTKAEVIDPAIPFPLPNKIDLELLNLSFTYPGRSNEKCFTFYSLREKDGFGGGKRSRKIHACQFIAAILGIPGRRNLVGWQRSSIICTR
jgi:ATP-binding cassette subfamily C protein CydC